MQSNSSDKAIASSPVEHPSAAPTAGINAPLSNPKWRIAQYLERRWWRRYLRARSPERYLADKKRYWEKLLRQLKHQPDRANRSLDAGCGPAGVFIFLEDRENITALDPLLVEYEQDLAIFARRDYPAVTFIVSALESAPSSLGPFDTIYCFNAINHVADWEKALDRLGDWARPGTRLLISSDVHRNQWLRRIFWLLPGDLLHPQQHGPAEYRAMLTSKNWKIEREVRLRRTPIFDYVGWVAVYEEA